MAQFNIVMPQMGESITNGTITKWHKNVGDIVLLDEILFEISTDKVESEIPSPVKGRVVSILFKEGDTVDVNVKIAVVEDDLSVKVASAQPQTQKVAEVPTTTQKTVAPVVAEIAKSHEEKRFYTPLVRAMAKEAGLKDDDLAKIPGTGGGGRVTRTDLENYLKGGVKESPVKSATMAAPISSIASLSGERVEVIVMDNMRKTIAKNMVEAKLTAPHVNSISEVDLTHLVKFREGFKAEFIKREGFNLTYTPFIMRALILALKEFPFVNASIDGDKILVKKDINLGCAVAVPGNGLVVPVIKNADTLNMTGLCRAVNQLAEKARNKKLSMDDISGGTFTFTNVGSFGTLLATPIILRPQVGIYAAGKITKRVMVMKDDAIAVRSMMYGTHTYDHRLVDGELGGKFLEAVHGHLTEIKPETLF